MGKQYLCVTDLQSKKLTPGYLHRYVKRTNECSMTAQDVNIMVYRDLKFKRRNKSQLLPNAVKTRAVCLLLE